MNRYLLLPLLLTFFAGCITNPEIKTDGEKALVKPPIKAKADKKDEVTDKKEEKKYDYVEYKYPADLYQSAVENYEKDEDNTAYILFDRILREYPKDALVEDSLFHQANILASKEFYERAAKKYEELLSAFPETRFKEKALYSLYWLYGELKWDEKKKEAGDKFMSAFPKSDNLPPILLDAANNFYDSKDYVKALGSYVDYYEMSKEADKRDEAYEKALIIIEDKLTISELQDNMGVYADNKFPGAYIMLKVAKQRLDEKNIADAKPILLEIEEIFPTFDKMDEVREELEKIKERAKKPAVIACLLPLTGKYEAYGQKLLSGILLAADVFSKEEADIPITVVVKDTKGDPEMALKMLDESYEEDKAMAIIGPLLSKDAQICAKRAEELEIPIMLLTQKEEVTKGYKYAYRKFLTNSEQVSSLVNYAMDNKGLLRFAIMHPENSYGNELKEMFFNEVTKKGGEIIAAESYSTEINDFTTQIKKLVGLDNLDERKRQRKLWIAEVMEEERADMQYMIKSEAMSEKEVNSYLEALQKELTEADFEAIVNFQAVFIPDTYSRAGLIIPQMLYYDIDKDVLKLGTNTYNSSKLIDIAQDNADGIVFVDGFFKDSSDKTSADFVSKYKDTFKAEPTLLEAEAYDSARIIINLIRSNDIQDKDELKDALDSMQEYKGATGVVKRFNNGEADEELPLLTVKKGKIIELITAPINNAPTP